LFIIGHFILRCQIAGPYWAAPDTDGSVDGRRRIVNEYFACAGPIEYDWKRMPCNPAMKPDWNAALPVKNLNTASKVILLIGLLVFMASGIWVPWEKESRQVSGWQRPTVTFPAESLGYGFIWSPKEPQHHVDTTRLLIQWAMIITGTAAGIVLTQLVGGRKDSEV